MAHSRPFTWVVLPVLLSLLAYFANRYHDLVCCLLPPYYDAYFIRWLYPRSKKNVGVSRMPLVSTILPTNLKKSQLKGIFQESGNPALVQNILNTDQDEIVKLLSEVNAGKQMKMLDYETNIEPHISYSCANSSLSTSKMVDFDYFAKHHLYSNVFSNHSTLYAGFQSITDPAVFSALTGLDIHVLGDYKQNNLFASNFAQDRMSAALHCAAIDSLSLQLVGTKTWYMISPNQLSELPAIPMLTYLNLPMTDDEMLSKVGNILVVKQRPGDVLYFGPNWCHAVYSDAGPNLMINIRYNALDKVKKGPFSLTLKLLLRKLLRPKAIVEDKPQDMKKHFPLIYDDITSYYPACGESEALNSMIERVRRM